MIATIAQPPLPFREYQVPALLLRCFHLANAADYPEKHSLFYPFKDSFLRAHAVFDGYDLQTIVRKCFGCSGSGLFTNYEYEDTCYRCDGTGIYRTDRVLLARWELGGRIYHIPSPHSETLLELVTPKECFRGLIKHQHVSSSIGRRALFILLARYEPKALALIIYRRSRRWCQTPYNPLWGKWGWLRQQYDRAYVTYCDTDDGIPF